MKSFIWNVKRSLCKIISMRTKPKILFPFWSPIPFLTNAKIPKKQAIIINSKHHYGNISHTLGILGLRWGIISIFEAVMASVKPLTPHRQVHILCENRFTITPIRISGLPFDRFCKGKICQIWSSATKKLLA